MPQAHAEFDAFSAAPPDPVGRVLLQVRPTHRPYPLLEFLRVSPLLRSDIGRGGPGIPLRLTFELRDARAQPIEHAAVYIWHPDQQGWTIDFQGDELGAVSCMRGVQLSDESGCVSFETVYPDPCSDSRVPVYLQIYFNDGEQVIARTAVSVLLPHQPVGPRRGTGLALPEPGQTRRPSFNAAGDAAVLSLQRLVPDPDSGGLHGRICFDLAL